jgi:hypothetical protein
VGFVAISGLRAVAAQAPVRPPIVVNVHVMDSAGVGVDAADVAVVHGINDVRANGTTDGRGRVSLTVADPQGDYQLVVRRIGFARGDQFFTAGTSPMSFDVVMHRAVQALGAVKVTAEQDLKRKSYFIDADEIAKHADELIDASDILKKLKPYMVCGRSCSVMGKPVSVATRTRASVQVVGRTNVWVNGRRILLIATDQVCQIGKRGALLGLLAGTMQVLCEVRPEHIAQITFVDEFDSSIGKVGSNSALFIVLKPGIVYDPGAPSHVAPPAPQSAHAPTAPQHDSSGKLPLYRYRVLGVFDQATGDPIEGAQVEDITTGTYARTTSTGTVSLIFLPEGGTPVRISKVGYDDLTLAVEISPDITGPLTLLMEKKAPQ